MNAELRKVESPFAQRLNKLVELCRNQQLAQQFLPPPIFGKFQFRVPHQKLVLVFCWSSDVIVQPHVTKRVPEAAHDQHTPAESSGKQKQEAEVRSS